MGFRISLVLFILLIVVSCDQEKKTTAPDTTYGISLNLERMEQSGLDSIRVIVDLTLNNEPLSGANLDVNASHGELSSVTDHSDGTYSAMLTPDQTGVYSVTVNHENISATGSAIVFDTVGVDVGQPMPVAGDFVNTPGYEDGVTITPDGQYLFVQYGPVYFSGIIYLNTICSDPAFSANNLNDCAGRDNSQWVFETVGPYADDLRPGFPTGRIDNGMLTHLSSIVVPDTVNGLFVPPTVFYGFKRQNDGSFAEPFLLAFDDQNRGIQSAYGLSFMMTGEQSALFTVSWNDFSNNLADDSADLYSGTITMEQTNNLGSVTYNGDIISQSDPTIQPVALPSHAGVQGNSHIYYDAQGVVQSLWVDDEVDTHDLTVYVRTGGTFPDGTWQSVALPAVINTEAEESQPFFTGTRLYLRRGDAIVSHAYLGTNGSDYDQTGSWGEAQVILQTQINTEMGSTVAVGEPTIAEVDGKTLLYFVYGLNRAAGVNGLIDINMDAGFVELQ